MRKNGAKLVVAFVFLTLILAGCSVSAQTYTNVISNSEDWKDVYSVLHYGNLKSITSDFLVSTAHGPLLLGELNKESYVLTISSKRTPFVFNYGSLIKAKGFKGADEKLVDSANIDLIKELPDIRNFIIVGDSYGYNAIAAVPYAVVNRAWVFFANRVNIDEINSILENREVGEVLIYGFVDAEVQEVLSEYNPEIINSGDRFDDNIKIFEKYNKIKPAKQILLTNGDFIEKEIMSGVEPILFTGKDDVPAKISTYLKSSDVEVGVLVGADLVGAATNIRRSSGISVIVKFARGARAPTGSISAVEGLDLFYLPVPIMDLKAYSAKYNKATSQLEVTYKSDSNVPLFFKGTLTPIAEGEESTRFGDVEPIFIAPNAFKTVAYSDVKFAGNKLEIEIFTLYGESPTALEKILTKRLEVEMINVIDKCKINVEKVKYSKQKGQFIIEIKNSGDVDCWVDVELKDVLINNIKKIIGSDSSVKIASGKKNKIIIKQEMSDKDLESNKLVELIAYYGERENSLVNIFRGKFELGIEMISYATIGVILLFLIVVVTIIILIIIIKRRRNDEDW